MSSIVITGHTARSTRRGGTTPARVSRQAIAAPLRLTARGRLVLAVLVSALIATAVLGGVLVGGGTASAGIGSRPVPVTRHVVMPGETLWGIAQRLDPGADPREVIDQILELNHLATADVPAGLSLILPTRG
jgi:hypothetical protein